MKFNPGKTFGWLLLLAATVLILSVTGIVPGWATRMIVSWQALFILLGVHLLLTRRDGFGCAVLCTGAYFMIPHVYRVLGMPMPFEKSLLTTLFYAALLLAAGLEMLKAGRKWHASDKKFLEVKTGKKGVPQISCAFGQIDHAIIEKPFRGAVASTAFGETRLNLTRTNLPEGDSFLEVNNAFATTKITVPASWCVQVTVGSFMGDIKDRRTEKAPAGDRRLIVRGANAFGSIELESAGEAVSADESTEEKPETISVKHNNRVHIIPLDELFYIQADGDYVTLCTAQGNFLKEQTMKYFQQTLPPARFVRIHRSYIVSLAEIASVDCRGKESYYVILKNGTALRTSTTGYQELRQKLEI